MHHILAINPGSTSTKVGFFQDEQLMWDAGISYTVERLSSFNTVLEQLDMRREDLHVLIRDKKLDLSSLSAVVGRGGPFKPLSSGTYLIGQSLLQDIREGRVQADHVSNLGSFLAYDLAGAAGVPAYFVDPVSVNEFHPVARYSGLPDLERRSLLHTLNVKATAHRFAKEQNLSLFDINLIVAHLGGGISICPILKGRIVDVNNANEGGPFSPERTGSLPVSSLVKLCYSGKFTFNEMKKKLVGEGGAVAYLGTNDTREIEDRISRGDTHADEVYHAMAYQIAKEIGAMATVLKGDIQAVLLTGGMAHSSMLVNWIKERIGFLAPVHVYAGENELEALAMGALRILRGEEEALNY
jgi:butyrate kinase